VWCRVQSTGGSVPANYTIHGTGDAGGSLTDQFASSSILCLSSSSLCIDSWWA
jgi:hypothetical protein